MSVATLSASQTPSEKSKIRSSELSPLKLCIKFTPPSLALYYTVASSPGKKFLHTVNVSKEISAAIPAPEIYQKLLEREPAYWNPKTISKKQVLKLVEKLLGGTKKNDSGTATKTEESPKGSVTSDRTSYVKQLSIESGIYYNPVLVTNIEEVNAESVIVNPAAAAPSVGSTTTAAKSTGTSSKPSEILTKPEPVLETPKKLPPHELDNKVPQKTSGKKTASEAEKDSDAEEEPQKPTEVETKKDDLRRKAIEEYKAGGSDKSEDENESNEDLNKGGEIDSEENEEDLAKMMDQKDMQRVYEEMLLSNFFRCWSQKLKKPERGEKLPAPEAENEAAEQKEELSPEEIEYLRGFQRVFVEDLGEELLMDPAGNLYDMDGNLIGQAASDNEGGGDVENSEDRKYFEEEDYDQEPALPGNFSGIPSKKPEIAKQLPPPAKKLPPVAAPKRSHSP